MARPEQDPDRIDRASRLVRAPASGIYNALTDAAALAAWLPPEGMRGAVHAFEPRPGGRFSLTLTYETSHPTSAGKTSDDADTVEGRFIELVENERIVWDVDFVSDDPAFAGTMRMTWILASRAGGTEVTISAANVPPGIKPQDHAQGLASSLDNLAAHVEGAQFS